MTWHLAKIPKIAHFFWDDKPLSFLRWASIRSFSVLNPRWDVRLHVTGDNVAARWRSPENKIGQVDDYRGWLDRIENLRIVKEDRFSGMHGVHQSDILRTKYLLEDGGIWSDVDIAYHKRMEDLECNSREFESREFGVCTDGKWFPIAFMFSAPESMYFDIVHKAQIQMVGKGARAHNGYQRYGTTLFSGAFRGGSYTPIPISVNEVYQKAWRKHGEIFSGQTDPNIGIGVHWYGGSPSAALYEPQITHENWKEHPARKMLEATL